MDVSDLIDILKDICKDRYGDWLVYFCDDDDDDYTVNSVYVDDDNDICIESTDYEDDMPEFTAEELLEELKEYDGDTYVYFREEYEDGSWYDYEIDDNWYIGTDNDGEDILNIDCYDDNEGGGEDEDGKEDN